MHFIIFLVPKTNDYKNQWTITFFFCPINPIPPLQPDSSAPSISFLSWYNRMIHSVWQECESLLPCQTDIFLQLLEQTSLLRGCLFCSLFCACQRNLTHFTTNIVELQREVKKKHAFPVIQASMAFKKFN